MDTSQPASPGHVGHRPDALRPATLRGAGPLRAGFAGMAGVSDGAGEARRSTAIPRPPEAGGPTHERSRQGRGTDPSRSLTIECDLRASIVDTARQRLRASDRWLLAGAAFLVQLALGAVYAWSVFVKPLRDQMGWSRTEATLPFIVTIGVVFLGTFVGASRTALARDPSLWPAGPSTPPASCSPRWSRPLISSGCWC
jgi:hypothetical protein